MGKLFFTGDIHGDMDIHKLNKEGFPEGDSLTKEDYVVICGDFGLIWDAEMSKYEEYWLKWLSTKPWTTLFIDGNHENHVRLNSYPVEEWHGGKVHKITDSVIHLMRGQIYDICGKSVFTFGGAESTDKWHRTEGKSIWKEELPNAGECEFALDNLAAHGNKVDIIVTHCHGDHMLGRIRHVLYSGHIEHNILTNLLSVIDLTVEYKQWFCGHYHADYIFNDKNIVLYDNIVEYDLEKDSIDLDNFYKG